MSKTKDNLENNIQINFDLKEAKFDDDKREATVTLIKEGKSLNYTNGRQRYYTARATENIAGLIKESRKMYLNHKSGSREVQEWTATAIEGWTEKNATGLTEAKAKIKFTKNPFSLWLYETAKEFPEEVGLSIDGSGVIREGKKGEETLAIVEEVKVLRSVDFVTVPAAGGKVDFAEALGSIENEITEKLGNFKDKLDKVRKIRQPGFEYNTLIDAFMETMFDIFYSDKEENTDKLITEMMKVMETELKRIVGEHNKRFTEEFVNNIDTVLIPKVKKVLEGMNIPETDWPELLTKEQGMDLNTFKKENPDAYSLIEGQANILAKVTLEKEYEEKIKNLDNQVSEAKKALTAEQEAHKVTKNKLDDLEMKEKQAEKEKFISDKLKENKIDTEVSESFKEILNSETDTVKIEKLIKDKASTISELKSRLDNGLSRPVQKQNSNGGLVDRESRKNLFLVGKE
ncbi:MAG: hypothetical protein PHC29_08625 [Candidatus Omnitrophica bacterium]|nr:hypothetical protein [Candidatus Omnitrophota bacterium]